MLMCRKSDSLEFVRASILENSDGDHRPAFSATSRQTTSSGEGGQECELHSLVYAHC